MKNSGSMLSKATHTIYEIIMMLLMNLGQLEKLVLKFFWQTHVADAKQVYAYFEKSRGGTLNTIQSTLDRLFNEIKGSVSEVVAP